MKEKYSCYEFEVYKMKPDEGNQDKWSYTIFCEPDYMGYNRDEESDEWYETEAEARFAAIGHIDKLENGPDDPEYY